MALKDALKAGPVRRERPQVMRIWRDSLDAETRDAFDAAVENPEWSTAALHRLLQENGAVFSRDTVSRYREAVLGGRVA